VLLTFEQAARLKVGQTIAVQLPQLEPGANLTGRIDFIDPRVDAASGYQRVKVLLENPGRKILPGTRGSIRLPGGR